MTAAAWPRVRLDEISRPKQWKTIPKSEMSDDGLYPVFGANGIIGRYDEFNHEHPTILITCRGATCGTINVCEPKSWVTGNAMAIDELDVSRADFRYLVHALQADGLKVAVNGAAQPQITRKSLEMVKIPLPPIEEQRRIAAVLDAADALRAKRRQAIAKLDTLTQAIFIDMFGDPVLNDRGWADAGFDNGLKSLRYGPRFYNESYSVEGTPMIRITDVDDSGAIDFTHMPKMALGPDDIKKYRLTPGDIIFARSGSVGRVALIDETHPECIAGAYFVFMRFIDELLPAYVFGVLQTDRIQEHISTKSRQVAQPNFSGPAIRRLPLPIPPMRDQLRYQDATAGIGIEKAKQAASLESLDTLFAALQQRAFRGEL